MNDFKLQQLLKKKPVLLFILVLGAVLLLSVILLTSPAKDSGIPVSDENQLSQPDTPTIQNDSNPVLQKDQPPELQQAIREQTQVDRDYADWQESVRNNYPWKKHLPLYTDRYYVYFDINSSSFVALLYPQPGDDLTAMKVDISNTLYGWGINLEDYNFDWRVSTQ